MPLLGLFKKDKHKREGSKPASSPGHDDVEFVDLESPRPLSIMTAPEPHVGRYSYNHSNASHESPASSTKIKQLFRKKQKSSSPLAQTTSNDSKKSSDLSSFTGHTTRDSAPFQTVLPSFHHEDHTGSTLSLPSNLIRRPPLAPLTKVESATTASATSTASSGMFSWARQRTKSRPLKPDPPLLPTPDSFNLKSFRHVQLGESLDSSSQDALPQSLQAMHLPPARPRENSVASSSDSAQRMSVALFRAQARRSSTNLTSNNPSPSAKPVSLPDEQKVDNSPPPRPPRAARPQASSARGPRKLKSFSPMDSSSSESEEDSDSERSRSRSGLSRQRTITQSSSRAKSDIGHGGSRPSMASHRKSNSRSDHGHGSFSPPPSSFQKSSAAVGTRSFSIYRRQQASYSTSELSPSTATQRASVATAANAQYNVSRSRQNFSSNDDTSSSDSSDDSSEDDAPLSTLLHPTRPGSSMSHSTTNTTTTRASAQRSKPLIDLNVGCNPLTGKPASTGQERPQVKDRPVYLSPTNISDRLSQLTTGLGNYAKSTASKSEDSLLSKHTTLRLVNNQGSPQQHPADSAAKARVASPARGTSADAKTASVYAPKVTASPEKMRAPSLPPDNEAPQVHDTGAPRPIRVQGRNEPNSGFKVVSRPQRANTSPTTMISPQLIQSTSSDRSSNSSFLVTSRPDMKPSTIDTKPSQPQPERPPPPLLTPRALSSQPPQRPFAGVKRRDSPSSSTGGSSSSKAPLTPNEGSDYFSPDVGNSDILSTNGSKPSAMKGGRRHLKRNSVSFLEPDDGSSDDERVRGRSGGHRSSGNIKLSSEKRESLRRERRLSEAKASIELGNVINGKGPTNDDEDEDGDIPIGNAMGPRMGMLSQMNNMGNAGLSYSVTAPMAFDAWQRMQMPNMLGGGVNPQTFGIPAPAAGVDPSFLAAHQQAMAIAKQAYQLAVAQQAMAAAGDEWERGSNIGGYSASNVGIGPMGTGLGGMGMMGMGMPGWGSPMFGARSMYAGSSIGPPSDAGWGTGSVYGDSFGPLGAATRRSQLFNSGGSAVGYPAHTGANTNAQVTTPRNTHGHGTPPSGLGGGSKPGTGRPRTKTAPSSAPLPPQHARFGGRNSPTPPSSWKVGQ